MHRSQILAGHLGQTLARNAAVKTVLADEGDDRMRVMNDGEGARLLMDVYTNYVSEYDYGNFPKFMKDVDNLLFKARGNKPFTHADRQAAEADNPPSPARRRGKKRPKPKATPSPAPAAAPDPAQPITASAPDSARHVMRGLSLFIPRHV